MARFKSGYLISQISEMFGFNGVRSPVSAFVLAMFRSKPLQISRMSGLALLI